MADQKVSELTEVTSIEDYDSIYVVVGGESRRIAKHNFAVDLEVAQADHADNADHALDSDHADSATLADDATKLQTARTFSLGGDCGGSTSFDGSTNVTTNVTVHNDSHSHSSSTISSITTSVAGNATKGLAVGAVGSYMFASLINQESAGPGEVKSGSLLRHAGINQYGTVEGNALPGNWRCMGVCVGYDFDGDTSNGMTLWLRIS